MTDEVREQRTSLRCRLGFHKWVGLRRANGERYAKCDRCGHLDDRGAWWSAPGVQ